MEHRTPAAPAAISVNQLSFRWPGADAELISDQTLTIPPGRVGLIGGNGSGKSTLVGLLTGRHAPTGGTISTSGDVWVMPQDLPTSTDSVAQVLGIATARAALRRLLAGEGTGEDVDLVGEDWSLEEDALAALAGVGYRGADPDLLDRPLASLSGGQAMRVGLAAARMSGAAWTVLDEPSNNLDAAGRAALAALIEGWPGGLLLVSHDRELLDRVDAIVELRGATLRLFGGNFEAYRSALAVEQEAARSALAKAKGDHAEEKRQRIASQTTLARRVRAGDKASAEKREPKIVMGLRKREAQVSAGKLRGEMAQKEEDARRAVDEAAAKIRKDVRIRLDLAATAVPAGRRVLRIGGFEMVGPERVRLEGHNGSGKSTLLEAIVSGDTRDLERRVPRADARPWSVTSVVPVGILRQDPALPGEISAAQAVRRRAPGASEHRIREILAGLELRGEASSRLCRDLSGGERLRVALAGVLAAEPAPQLLLLDEPSNNLDLESVEVLSGALAEFEGAVLLVTHDPRVAEDAGVQLTVTMGELAGDDSAAHA